MTGFFARVTVLFPIDDGDFSALLNPGLDGGWAMACVAVFSLRRLKP